ncbi:hypothetical protein JCM10599A_64750 [Paraburkholderia kururiensis]
MGKDNAALAIGKHCDAGDLAAFAPGGRCGVGVFALAVDRLADRLGDTLVKAIGKKHGSTSRQGMKKRRTKKNALPGHEERVVDSIEDDPCTTSLSGTWCTGSREALSGERKVVPGAT